MNLGPWGDLTILAAVMEMVFATCVFVYISRLEKRTSHPLGEKVGAHKAVLAKLRKREPWLVIERSQDGKYADARLYVESTGHRASDWCSIARLIEQRLPSATAHPLRRAWQSRS